MKAYTEAELRHRLERSISFLRSTLLRRPNDAEELAEISEDAALHAGFSARYGFALLRLREVSK